MQIRIYALQSCGLLGRNAHAKDGVRRADRACRDAWKDSTGCTGQVWGLLLKPIYVGFCGANAHASMVDQQALGLI